MTPSDIDVELRSVLRPLMSDKNSRKARLTRAFANYPGLLERIDVDGEPGNFMDLLIHTLREYGEVEPGNPAVCVLLKSIKDEVGVRDRTRIDSIVRIIHESSWSDVSANPY